VTSSKHILVNLENLGTGKRQTHKTMRRRTRTFIGKVCRKVERAKSGKEVSRERSAVVKHDYVLEQRSYTPCRKLGT